MQSTITLQRSCISFRQVFLTGSSFFFLIDPDVLYDIAGITVINFSYYFLCNPGSILNLSWSLRPGRQWNGDDILAILLFQSWMKKRICVSYARGLTNRYRSIFIHSMVCLCTFVFPVFAFLLADSLFGETTKKLSIDLNITPPIHVLGSHVEVIGLCGAMTSLQTL